MKFILTILTAIFFLGPITGCRTSKKINRPANNIDSLITSSPGISNSEKKAALSDLEDLAEHHIDFNTFSARAKVEYQDKNGSQPDVNVVVRLKKDSILWLSISATLLNIEAFRILITPDQITILDKFEKTVEHRPFKYLETIAPIPLNFSVLQDLIVGNPLYMGDNLIAYKKSGDHILIGTMNQLFTNIITLSAREKLLQRITLESKEPQRTATLIYADHQKNNKKTFAALREINVNDESKVNIKMSFRQYEFNNELSFIFNVPGNYKIK